ncbi:MAG TPA: hypothetical protein VLC50_02000 [Actinomycetes bacterium]|nr:hypothetical protein [Actinomycetes bacterium]
MITALVLAATTGLLPLAAAPVAAAPAAACPGGAGVTVVVDFGQHGGTAVRCAAGDPASASEALDDADFDQARVQRQPAFLCRIDGVPSAKQDACVVTPPATAYWALWTAARGGSWKFAPVGVDLVDPEPGSVVGFAFGAGAKPGVAPPAPAAASRPSSSRTTKPAAAPSTRVAAPSSSASTTRAAAPSASSTPVPSVSAASTAATVSAAAPDSAAAPRSLPATPAAGRAEGPSDEAAGGSLGPWVGAGLIGLVGLAAGARSWQRRRR